MKVAYPFFILFFLTKNIRNILTPVGFIILLLMVVSVTGFGQSKQHQLDSLKLKLQKDSARCFRFKRVRPFVSLDNRHSFIKEAPVNVKGFQLGVTLHERHTMGFGVYSIQKNSKEVSSARNDQKKVAIRALSLSYLTTFYQYVVISKRFYQIDLPLEVGIGSYQLNFLDTLTKLPIAPQKKGGLLLAGAGVGLTFKPTRWLGLTGTAGLRGVLDGNSNINFSGAYYSYGIWLDLRQIYRDVKYYGFIKKKYNKKVNGLTNH